MKQLSKAGLSVLQVGVYSVEKLGEVYDIFIDKPLNEESFNKLYTYLLRKYNYFPAQLRSTPPVIRLFPVKKSGSKTLVIKLLLLSLTILTVTLTGYGLIDSFNQLFHAFDKTSMFLWSITYTILFLSALGFHEAGHILASRRSGIVIDGPYFIPAPPIQLGFIGTLGAVINMKTLPPDRKSLAKLGISGPLAGFIAGLLVGILGVMLSPEISISKAKELIAQGKATEASFLPVIVTLLLLLKPVKPGYTIFIHPILLVSIIVFLVTFLNLLPIAQLDGGHVVRSYVSMKTYEKIGYFLPVTLLFIGVLLAVFGVSLGMFLMALSFVLLIIKYVLGRKPHPGPANQFSEIKDYRYLILYIALLILTMPIPVA